KGCTDGQVNDVVQGVHREDDQVGTFRGEEPGSRGDEESEHAYQKVHGSEDGGDQAIGRSAHWSEPSGDGRGFPSRPVEPRTGLSNSDSDHALTRMGGIRDIFFRRYGRRRM